MAEDNAQTLIDSLNRTILRLEGENTKRKDKQAALQAQLSKIQAEHEQALKAVRDERDEFEKTLISIADERDALQSQIETNPSELQKQLDTLRGELRNRNHRDAFNKLSKGQVREDALEAAWKLMDWKADADDIDEAKMGESIKSLVSSNGFLAPQGDGGQPGGTVHPSQRGTALPQHHANPRPSGPGLSRGGSLPTDPGDRRAQILASVDSGKPMRIA